MSQITQVKLQHPILKLAGGLKYLFIFTPKMGKMNPIWLVHIFQMGWVETTNYYLVNRLVHPYISRLISSPK